MGILSNKGYFQLKLQVGSGYNAHVIENHDICFFDNPADLTEENYQPQINIREDSALYLLVGTRKHFKLYLDGLEESNIHYLQHPDGNYFCTANKMLKVFEGGGAFPLPTGKFHLKVCLENKIFYTGIRVYSEKLDGEMWRQMVRELSEYVQQLAYQMRYSDLALMEGSSTKKLLGPLFGKIDILNRYFYKLMAAINDLLVNPHSRVAKEYRITHNTVGNGDFKSNKLNSRNKLYQGNYVPVKHTDYNIPENCYIKKVVLDIDQLLRKFMLEVRQKLLGLGQQLGSKEQDLQIVQDYYYKVMKLQQMKIDLRKTPGLPLKHKN